LKGEGVTMSHLPLVNLLSYGAAKNAFLSFLETWLIKRFT
jgi:hypothetical protein